MGIKAERLTVFVYWLLDTFTFYYKWYLFVVYLNYRLLLQQVVNYF